jgi:signal transduction histidine kinase
MNSFYTKHVGRILSIILVSGLLAFILSNLYYQNTLKPQNDEKITTIAHTISNYIEDNPSLDLHEYLENIATIGYQLYIVDEEKQGTFYGADFRETYLESSAVDKVLDGEVYHGIANYPPGIFITGFFANELKNTIGVPISHGETQYAMFLRPDIKLLFNEMRILFAWILLLTIVFTIGLVLFSTIYLVRPLSQLTKATRAIADGHYDYNGKLATYRHDELGELSRSFLQMATKLEQTDEIRKEFIGNISHDIQSPLSNIKGYANLLEGDSLSEEEKKQYIGVINDETERLSSLTKQLLLLASLEQKEDLVNKRQYNLNDQLKEIIRNYQWKASEKDIMLSYNLPDVEVYADPALLNTVWDNLLVNAIKYNKTGGSVEIELQEKRENIIVTFKDTGIGLKQEETERIFDRFYRADESRTRTVKGTGLGLSIVWTIMNLHDGNVTVQSEEGKGTVFTVTLPVQTHPDVKNK